MYKLRPIPVVHVNRTSYRGADRSLALPGRKVANVSVRMAWISFGALPCRKKKLEDSSRLDAVEIARVARHASELVSFLVGLRTYQHLGTFNLRFLKVMSFWGKYWTRFSDRRRYARLMPSSQTKHCVRIPVRSHAGEAGLIHVCCQLSRWQHVFCSAITG